MVSGRGREGGQTWALGGSGVSRTDRTLTLVSGVGDDFCTPVRHSTSRDTGSVVSGGMDTGVTRTRGVSCGVGSWVLPRHSLCSSGFIDEWSPGVVPHKK